MTPLWQEENRIPTLQEARTYLDTHLESDDRGVWDLGARVADAASGHTVASNGGGRTEESSFVKPPEEQLEEDGAD